MLKNIKLGTKIMIGFGVVLLLLTLVAYVGYKSLTGVIDRVGKTNDVNHMTTMVLELRQLEKNYIIREDDASVKGFDEKFLQLTEQIVGTKNKFRQPDLGK